MEHQATINDELRNSRTRPPVPTDSELTIQGPLQTSNGLMDAVECETETLNRENVLELEAFIERKQWIQEQIKILESLPTLDIYEGFRDLRIDISAERPSQESLKLKLQEVCRIERQTEQFDAGDMLKLKQFAKAATKRNLSPRDTDLIEVTMDTLVALDKLLHLLRTRSDALDALGLRLRWEDTWRDSWQRVHTLLKDIEHFLASRARWMPDIYEKLAISASFTPHSSDSSSTISSESDVSDKAAVTVIKSERHKFSELLSRDAAHFASRWNILKNSGIPKAGKLLDQLIDSSLVPVPDYFLDEQDKLEDLCNRELGDLGTFILAVVSQWKKCDEIFVEAKKDQSMAKALIQDALINGKQHPSPQLTQSLTSRLASLEKRSSMRSGSNLRNMLPSPVHLMYPDHSDYSARVTFILEREVDNIKSLVFRARESIQQYCAKVAALESMEILQGRIGTLSSRFESIRSRLKDGLSLDGDDEEICFALDLDSKVCIHQDIQNHPSWFFSLKSEIDLLGDEYATLSQRLRSAQFILQDCPAVDPAVVQKMEDAQRIFLKHQTTVLEELKVAETRFIALQNIQTWWDDLNDRHTQCLDIDKHLLRLIQLFESDETIAEVTKDSQETFMRSVSEAEDSILSLEAALHQLEENHLSSIPSALHDSISIRYLHDRSQMILSWAADFKLIIQFLNEVGRSLVAVESVEIESKQLLSRITHLKAQPMWVPATNGIEPSLFDEALVSSAEHWSEAKKVEEIIPEFLGRLQNESVFFQIGFPLNAKEVHCTEPWADLLDWHHFQIPTSISTGEQLMGFDGRNRRRLNTLIADLLDSLSMVRDKFRLQRVVICSHWTEHLESTMNRYLSSARHELECVMANFTKAQKVSSDKLFAEWQTILRRDISFDINTAGSRDETLRQIDGNIERLRSLSANDADISLLLNKLTDSRELFRQESANLLEQASCLIKDISKFLLEKPSLNKQCYSDPCASSCGGSTATKRGVGIKRSPTSSWQSEETTEKHASSSQDPAENFGYFDSLRKQIRRMDFGDNYDDIPPPDFVRCTLANVNSIRGEFETMKRKVDTDTEGRIVLCDLQEEVDEMLFLATKLIRLDAFGSSVKTCDAAISNLLNALDVFQELAINNVDDSSSSRDTASEHYQQLSIAIRRLDDSIVELKSRSESVVKDFRAKMEMDRITRTADELRYMAHDILQNPRVSTGSRSVSNASSTSTSLQHRRLPEQLPKAKKQVGGLQSIARVPVQTLVKKRIASISDRTSTPIRSPSTARSVSGPVSGPFNQKTSTLYNSTFASRSRTTSLSAVVAPLETPTKRILQFDFSRCPASPAATDVFTSSRPAALQTPKSINRSTSSQSTRRTLTRKPYVANPASQLDMAVGRVINRLPMRISMKADRLDWKDRSGKYWIGDEEPRLYFCRILRSETVMVRVGGGWSELSRFIKDHFAAATVTVDRASFSKEERWFSAAALRRSMGSDGSRPETPTASVPTVTISSPGSRRGHRSTDTTPQSPPLSQIQFVRNIDSPEIKGPMQTPFKTPSKTRNNRTSQLPGWIP